MVVVVVEVLTMTAAIVVLLDLQELVVAALVHEQAMVPLEHLIQVVVEVAVAV
jgi:hypothetical protein